MVSKKEVIPSWKATTKSRRRYVSLQTATNHLNGRLVVPDNVDDTTEDDTKTSEQIADDIPNNLEFIPLI